MKVHFVKKYVDKSVRNNRLREHPIWKRFYSYYIYDVDSICGVHWAIINGTNIKKKVTCKNCLRLLKGKQ
jgi:hypothetical protein